MLGNGRVYVKCFDEIVRVGHIRGQMRRKVWIQPGDIVLCSLREFQNKKCDIIIKYLPDEVKQLKAQGHIPDQAQDSQSGNNDKIKFGDNANYQGLADLSDSESDEPKEEDVDSSDDDIKQKKQGIDINAL
jgi:translation initiation factor 1A